MDHGDSHGRILIVADEDGNILGGAMPSVGRQGDSPPRVAVAPMEGQSVHSVVLPEAAMVGGSAELALVTLRQFRLQVDATEARLVRRSDDELTSGAG